MVIGHTHTGLLPRRLLFLSSKSTIHLLLTWLFSHLNQAVVLLKPNQLKLTFNIYETCQNMLVEYLHNFYEVTVYCKWPLFCVESPTLFYTLGIHTN